MPSELATCDCSIRIYYVVIVVSIVHANVVTQLLTSHVCMHVLQNYSYKQHKLL